MPILVERADRLEAGDVICAVPDVPDAELTARTVISVEVDGLSAILTTAGADGRPIATWLHDATEVEVERAGVAVAHA